MKITTQKQVRELFWDSFPEFAAQKRSKKKQGDYHADIRCSFVDFVDMLMKSKEISNKLAERVTL